MGIKKSQFLLRKNRVERVEVPIIGHKKGCQFGWEIPILHRFAPVLCGKKRPILGACKGAFGSKNGDSPPKNRAKRVFLVGNQEPFLFGPLYWAKKLGCPLSGRG